MVRNNYVHATFLNISRFQLDLLHFKYIDLSFMELGKIAEEGCNEECSYNRKCVQQADWFAAYSLRKTFWGESFEEPYMPKKRLEQIVNIFKLCEYARAYIYIIFVNEIR